jgi:hypothetical protein
MKRYAFIDKIKKELLNAQSKGISCPKKKIVAEVMLMGASRRLTNELIQMFIDAERIVEVDVEGDKCLIWKLQDQG